VRRHPVSQIRETLRPSLHRVVAGLTLVLGCAASLVGAHLARRAEERRVESAFDRVAAHHFAAVQKTLALNLQVPSFVESFYAASQLVERGEFRAFAANILSRRPSVAALQWAPRVLAAERTAHEAAAREDGLKDYRVTELDDHDRPVAAGPRDEYFPIYYSEPREGLGLPLGLDLASNLARAQLLARACCEAAALLDNGQAAGQAPDEPCVASVFAPVYRRNAPLASPAERRENLLGYVVGVYRVPELLAEALRDFALGGVRFNLYDVVAPETQRLLCSYPGGPALVGVPAGGLRREAVFDVAGRRWRLVCVPTGDFLAAERTELPLVVLGAGLLFTLVLSGYLVVLVGRAARIAKLVNQRTEELVALNDDLANEIDRRRLTELELRQARGELEARVQERTAELHQAVDALRAEIQQRIVAEEDALQRTAMLEASNQVLRESLTCEEDAAVARVCLAVAEKLTGSRFGFIGEVNEAGRFDTIALSDPGWDSCRMPHSEATRLIRGMEVRGLWGAVLRSQRALIVNDPATHPDRVGIPEGHPPLTSFLGVPLKHAGKTIGMIALANKPSGYSDRDREGLEALAVAFVEALMRSRAEAALRRAHAELEERVRERTAELARSNAELEQFAYVASHDLQEPLRMVRSFVELLQQRYAGQLDAEADEFIGFAVDGAARMQALIRGLLAYSRVDRRTSSPGPVDCDRLVQNALRNLQVAIAEAKAQVTHDPLPTVTGDETQLLQLFQNLLGNAIKFRNEAAPRVHIAAARRGAEWVFSVRDNGIGFDPQYAERIFMIFQRLHTREEYGGTGIGLAVCKKIVECHGGRIWAESAPGQGSTFYFTLPVKGEENP